MNGRVEHNTALFTTNREQVILSFRKSLEPLLNKLSQDEVALDGKPQDVSDLDESIEGFLTFLGSKFSLWIFDSFMDSIALQTELWVSFFYPVVNRYRTEVVGKYKANFLEKPVAANQAAKRFDKICKHVSHFYKQFVTRIVETFGCTPQLYYAVSILHLTPSLAGPAPSANEKMAHAIHLSVHDSLCHLGDLSRYRTSNGYKSDHLDYTHALVYYTTAFKIQPSSGMPFNQLGNISYSNGDIFSGTYFFLRSVAVDEPFRDGSSNLRIILKKLLKIKDASLPKLKIAGVDSVELAVEESGIDNANDFDDMSNVKLRKRKENVAEVKENLMRLLQLYSNYYMSHLPTAKAHDAQLSEALQIELTDKTYELVRAQLIPSKVLVKMSIISITFIWLLEQANDGTGMLNDAYKAALRLTLRLIDKLLSATLYHASQDEFGIMHLGDRVKPAVRTLLPAFRIYFDWMNKQADQMRIAEWGQISLQCNALFLKMSQLLEHLRKAFGFQFDFITAVPRSNWDRFEDLLKEEEEAPYSDTEESGSLNDLSISSVSQKSKRRYLFENDEETQCSGLLPINGGLNDTPSGLGTVREGQRSAQEVYRAQCILFTGVEISRLHSTFLELDEFEREKAEFNFVMMEFEEPEEDDIIVTDEVVFSEPDVAATMDFAPESLGIDETELYKLISRNKIPQELQSLRFGNKKQSDIPSGPGATSADHSNRAIELEKMQAQFIARPGSSAQSVNASASPEFLRRLRTLESNGDPKNKGARGGKKKMRGKAIPGSSSSGEKERRNRIGDEPKRNVKNASEKVPSPKGSQSHQLGKKQAQQQAQHVILESDGTSNDAESSDADSSDEEIVFLGRARAKH